MGTSRAAVPDLEQGLVLADGGGEWEALRTIEGRGALREHLLGLIELARALDAGFVLDAPIFQCRGLPIRAAEAQAIDRRAIEFAAALRDEAALGRTVLLNATLEPCPGWEGEWPVVGDESERLFVSQLRWLSESAVDLVSGPAFGRAGQAAAFVEAARAVGLPVAVTLALDSSGWLADGKALRETVEAIDRTTGAAAAWFTVRCADPAHLLAALDTGDWTRRVRGIQIEAGTMESPEPAALRRAYQDLAERAPWLNIAGLSGGQGLRHAAAQARALRYSETVAA